MLELQNRGLENDPEFRKRLKRFEKEYLDNAEREYVNETYRIPYERQGFLSLGVLIGLLTAYGFDYVFQIQNIKINIAWSNRFIILAIEIAILRYFSKKISGRKK